MSDRNEQVIEEFRAHGGVLGGPFEGAPMLILHTVGAKSGEPRETPMMYLPDGDRYLVFASYGGAPHNPAWFHNLVANPDVSIEVGTSTLDVRAEVLEGDDRDRVYAKQAGLFPAFAAYQEKTSRTIPVVALAGR